MQLRPRQEEFTQRAVSALERFGNTLGVAPTGAGKTVMLSAIAQAVGGAQIILQHRDELIAQNRATYQILNPDSRTSIYNASEKVFTTHGATFAMVQTLYRHLDAMPPSDLIVIDEAHHAAARTYRQVIARAKELNPHVKILGVTATPNRGDKLAMRGVFDNCADQIELGELIRSGHLVPPRLFGIKLSVEDGIHDVIKKAEATRTKRIDQNEIEAIMDSGVVFEEIINAYLEHAADRQTVCFCPTINYMLLIAEAFQEAGVKVGTIDGEMSKADRADVLRRFDSGEIQIIFNCMVLTEGWDCQPVSCVMILRPCMFKSTMLQMIGRGLRKVDPSRYPGIVKSDCIVLDFGATLHIHEGVLFEEPDLDGEAGVRSCPECEAVVPAPIPECPICGFVPEELEPEETETQTEPDPDRAVTPYEEFQLPLGDFSMVEIDAIIERGIKASPFKWEKFYNGTVIGCSGLTTWAFVIHHQNNNYYALCGDGSRARCVAVSDNALAPMSTADDWMRNHESATTSAKYRRWASLRPTAKQIPHLNRLGFDVDVSRYRASCSLTWGFNLRKIETSLKQEVRQSLT